MFAGLGSGVQDEAVLDPALYTLPPTIAGVYEDPDAAAAALALIDPGVDAIRPLLSLDARRLSDAGLIDALIATDRQLALLQARQQLLLAESARRDPDGDAFLREDVACALRLAPATTQQKLDTAIALTSRLWDTFEQIERGDLSLTHGRILAAAVVDLDDRVTAKVQASVLSRTAGQTPGEFRAAVRKAVARFDLRDQQQRHAVAFAERTVTCYPEQDGMASLWLRLAADGAATFLTALDACAIKCEPGDERTADQRRADAAVEIALAALGNPNLPTAHGMRPSVQITVAASTLLGLDDQPGELERYGPIPAELARRISQDPTGTWRRLITDDAGRLLDYQATVYKPPAALARHVITRDQRCVHPGCRRKAARCELDHRVPYPAGGTNAENLQPLCKRHHRMKHSGRWKIKNRPDGAYDWTSPTGHRYRYRPPELPVNSPFQTDRPAIDAEPPPF